MKKLLIFLFIISMGFLSFCNDIKYKKIKDGVLEVRESVDKTTQYYIDELLYKKNDLLEQKVELIAKIDNEIDIINEMLAAYEKL